jgi:hypothetical protein
MSIPKKIHQIWIGESSTPEDQMAWCNEIKIRHPDWQYIFWKNEQAESLMQSAPNNVRGAYERYTKKKQWAFASDILRYFILSKGGGVYMDCDFVMQPNGSLNQLPLEKDLILLNMRYYTKENPKYRFQNCFMACAPEHPFLKRIVKNIDNISYTLTTMDGRKTDKYSTKYVTSEYGTYLGFNYDVGKGVHVIRTELENIMPPNEVILTRDYFLEDNPRIAKHLYKLSHKICD